MVNTICIFASGSSSLPAGYHSAAKELGILIGKSAQTLVYGGTNTGLMEALATAVQDNGGKVVGIIPKFMHEMGLAFAEADELVVVDDLRERKRLMEKRSDAFVALPGGFGTLEEIMEVLALRQLKRHAKPVALVNTNGFYSALANLFERMYREQFAKEEYREYYCIAPTPREALAYIASFESRANTR